MFKLNGKRVLLVGLGARGRAACRLLCDSGASVLAVDRKDTTALQTEAKRLAKLGAEVHLGLANNSLTGTVPGGLLRPPMETLELCNNALRGSLPAFVGGRDGDSDDDESALELSTLKRLGIRNNSVSGGLPASWSALRSLRAVKPYTGECSKVSSPSTSSGSATCAREAPTE